MTPLNHFRGLCKVRRISRTDLASGVEGEIDKAVRQIYKKYGSDCLYLSSPMFNTSSVSNARKDPHGVPRQKNERAENKLEQTQSELSGKPQTCALH